ncbi:hypothetical protein SRHO_G00191610 [Serrasalmus rhombeus]
MGGMEVRREPMLGETGREGRLTGLLLNQHDPGQVLGVGLCFPGALNSRLVKSPPSLSINLHPLSFSMSSVQSPDARAQLSTANSQTSSALSTLSPDKNGGKKREGNLKRGRREIMFVCLLVPWSFYGTLALWRHAEIKREERDVKLSRPPVCFSGAFILGQPSLRLHSASPEHLELSKPAELLACPRPHRSSLFQSSEPSLCLRFAFLLELF